MRAKTEIRDKYKGKNNRRLALKDDKKPNINVKTQRQKVPDDEDIDINKSLR